MKLKKIFLYSATMLLLVSCANEDKQGSSGYGAINVQVSADYKVVPVTRSTAESASTIENPDVSEFALKLVSSDGSFSRHGIVWPISTRLPKYRSEPIR